MKDIPTQQIILINFMEEISSKTNMKEFRKEASALIDILPRDIAIETLQKSDHI